MCFMSLFIVLSVVCFIFLKYPINTTSFIVLGGSKPAYTHVEGPKPLQIGDGYSSLSFMFRLAIQCCVFFGVLRVACYVYIYALFVRH